MSIFKEFASQYWKAGFSPVPLHPASKRPVQDGWQKYHEKQPTPEEMEEWATKYPNANIGLVLGSHTVGDTRLLAIDIDVDDQEMIQRFVRAIGTKDPAKKGKKGLTIFVRGPKKIENTMRIKASKVGSAPVIEILSCKTQTVVPPSVHPDTGQPYEWLGKSLLDFNIQDLPLISEGTLIEFRHIAEGKTEWYDHLNNMVWNGVGGGGNTHDTFVHASAFLVAHKVPDECIMARLIRAKREAVERAGEVYDWPEAEKVIKELIDSAKNKGMEGSAVKASKIPPERELANWLVEELGSVERVACVNGKLRQYKNGYWPTLSVDTMEQKIYQEDPGCKKSEAENAVRIMHRLVLRQHFGFTPGIEPRNDPMRQKLCLTNGTLDLLKGRLEPHDPAHELTHQIDVRWDPEATCPVFDKFIEETFAGDKQIINCVLEFFAHTLVPDMSFQKMLWLIGPGGNGKGTLARVLTSLHDPNAIATVPTTSLHEERAVTSLVGKLLNISSEQSRSQNLADSMLKRITGGDPVSVRLLYREMDNNVYLTSRFIEMVNEMPRTFDISDALRRRFIIIPCNNKIKVPDPEIESKLYKERAGILSKWMVPMLRQLYERGRFDVPPVSSKMVDSWLLEEDPVAYWMTDSVEVCEEGQKGTPNRELYGHFAEWMKLMGFNRAMNEIQWGKRLTAKGFDTQTMRVGNTVVRSRAIRIKHGHDV